MTELRCRFCGALNRLRAHGSDQQVPICGRCKQILEVRGTPADVDGAGLDAAIRTGEVPLLVDFWAPWCGPCRAASPVIDRVAAERAGQLRVLKLNIEAQPGAAAAHQIQSIPCFVLFSSGREIARWTGAPSKADLDRWLDGWLLDQRRSANG